MRRRLTWWQLGIGLLLVAAPAWGETLPVESPSPVFNPGLEERGQAESSISMPIPVAEYQPSTLTLSSNPSPIRREEDNLTLTPNPSPIKGENKNSLQVLEPPLPRWERELKGEAVPAMVDKLPQPLTSPNSLPRLEVVKADLTPSGNGMAAEARLLGQIEPTPQPQATPNPDANNLDLSPEVIEGSPVLQRWLKKVPNVLEEIRNDPSFRTRLRLGYSQFSSDEQAGGFNVGVEDVFIGRTGFTVSGDYQGTFDGEREAFGADLRYYVLPLGSYVNVAPVVGYRNLETDDYSTDGLNVGLRLMLALSRTGAADVSLTQSFVSPTSREEVGITTLSFGYAVTRNLRLSTDIQRQNARQSKDSRLGIVLEWMP